MQILTSIEKLQTQLKSWRLDQSTIAFVPTMGGLHAGHLALVDLAKKRADRVVVSIFINPTQFASNEDLDSYPRTLEADLSALELKKVDVVFTPDVAQIYPKTFDFDRNKFGKDAYLFEILCGQTRPHFFYGVLQVVIRLFEIVRPNIAIFGQKDYQQLKIIKKFTSGIEIVSAPTMREHNGLAMSTRNAYLSTSQHKIAPQLYQILQKLASGKFSEKQARFALEKSFKVDYLEVLDGDTLEKINDNSHQIAILCAVFLGKIRLIDNIIFRRKNV